MSRQCLTCGKRAYSDYCVQHKPRKPLNKLGKRGKQNKITSDRFRSTLNPDQIYYCYLQIHEYCPVTLTADQVVPEHVKSKSGSPELRDSLENIKKACTWCNGLKGSRSLENLAKEYPHLTKYLTNG